MHWENGANAPLLPLGATARSTAISALVPFPAFFEDPRVCLAGAVAAKSAIIMGRGRNEEALEEEGVKGRDALPCYTCTLLSAFRSDA